MIGDPHYDHEMLTKRFALKVGAKRSDDFVPKAQWFNCWGRKIGWGDLSMADFDRIKANLKDHEVFVVLNDTASFWDQLEKPGLLGWLGVAKKEHYYPGTEKIAHQCSYLITQDAYYIHDPHVTDNETVVELIGREASAGDVRKFKKIRTQTVLSFMQADISTRSPKEIIDNVGAEL